MILKKKRKLTYRRGKYTRFIKRRDFFLTFLLFQIVTWMYAPETFHYKINIHVSLQASNRKYGL